MPRPKQERIHLDWFNVSYRTLVFGGVVIAVIAAVVILYLLGFLGGEDPRSEALRAINEADGLLKQFANSPEAAEFEEIYQRAEGRLGDAREAFQQTNFSDALLAAVESQQASRRLQALSEGADSVPQVQFYKIEGKVQVKKARQLVWKGADKSLPLDVGDQIKTDSSGSAQIIYFNGTITTIKPGSILEIQELYDDPLTRVQKVRETLRTGELVSRTQEASAEGSFHEVSTQNAIVQAIGPTEFETRFDELNRKTVVGVYRGAATVQSGGKQRELGSREQLSVDSGGQLGATMKLPPTPLLLEPMDQKIFHVDTDEDTAEGIGLLWEAVELPGAYHLQVSSSSLFGEVLLDRDGLSSEQVILPPTQPGSYYWRAAFQTRAGVESAFSETRKFKVIAGRVMNVDDTLPPELVIDDFLVFSSQVIVRGHTEAGAIVEANGKKVDVGDDGSFTSIIQLRREGRNTIRFVAQDANGNQNTVTRVAYVKVL